MKWATAKNIVAENIFATTPELNHKRAMYKRKLCWKCQKEKFTAGGYIKMFTDGPVKFVCKDCLEAKLKEKTHEHTQS